MLSGTVTSIGKHGWFPLKQDAAVGRFLPERSPGNESSQLRAGEAKEYLGTRGTFPGVDLGARESRPPSAGFQGLRHVLLIETISQSGWEPRFWR